MKIKSDLKRLFSEAEVKLEEPCEKFTYFVVPSESLLIASKNPMELNDITNVQVHPEKVFQWLTLTFQQKEILLTAEFYCARASTEMSAIIRVDLGTACGPICLGEVQNAVGGSDA